MSLAGATAPGRGGERQIEYSWRRIIYIQVYVSLEEV